MNWGFVNTISLNDDVETNESTMEDLMILSHDNLFAVNKINELDGKFTNTLCYICARPTTIDPIYFYSDSEVSLQLAKTNNSEYFGIKIQQETDSLPRQLCEDCIKRINCNNAFGIECLQAKEKFPLILEETILNDDNQNIECLDRELSSISDEDSNKTSEHEINITNNAEKNLLEPFSSVNPTMFCEKQFMTFQCLGNDHQYLKCNACLTLFYDKISLDNHKCKPLISNSSLKPYKCSTCNAVFSLEECLNFHRQFHQKSHDFNCNICNIKFKKEQKLFYHYKRYHCNSTTISCLQCGKLFDNQSQLRAHICNDGKIRQHICEICNKGFADGYTLKRHIVTHLPEKPFKCNQCTKSFTQKSRLNKHIADHEVIIEESQTCWKCLECGMIFPSCKEADEHCEYHENAIRIIEELLITKIYHCEFCNNYFDNIQTLKIHQSNHSVENPFNCTICKIEFKSFTEVVIHWKKHPRIFKVLTVFSCDICDKNTKDLALLYKHKRKRQHFTPKKSSINDKQMQYLCELCGGIFDKLEDIINHNKMACSKFPCDICGSLLPTNDSLEAHKRRHNGLRPYVCNICGKSYTQSSHMWAHKRFHMGIKPYACEYCDKKFTIKPDLADHTRKKHTRERPFKCEVCNKAFLTGSVFYQHRLIHRGDRRYKCNYCQKTFARTEALNNHVKIHTGEKPHKCAICGRCFRQKGDMRKHKRTQHAVENDKLVINGQIVMSIEEIIEIIDTP
ncbi:hypothetical protein PV326_007125 [Microctonus aethiopoides]|nr:hypothetical protein PV326_007125 [Microctonus aethiopoides]